MNFEHHRVNVIYENIRLYANLRERILLAKQDGRPTGALESQRIGVHNKLVTHLELLSSTLMVVEPRPIEQILSESFLQEHIL